MTRLRSHSSRSLALAALLFAPLLAGCIDNPFRDDPIFVRTTCEGTATALDTVPAPRAFTRSDRAPAVTPPFQGTVRVTLLLPESPPAGAVNGARLAVEELRAAGAPLSLTETTLTGAGAASGRAAFEAAARTTPSAIVAVTPNATTEGMVPSAVARRIPLLATETTASNLTTAQETAGMVLRVPPPDAAEGRAAADLVWASGCRSVNVVQAPGRVNADVLAGFRVAYEAKGGSIGKVVTFATPSGGDELRASAKAVAERAQFLRADTSEHAPRPAALLVLAPPTPAGVLLREAWKIGATSKTVLFFSDASQGKGLVDAAGADANRHGLAEGLRGTSPMRADSGMTDLFARTYELEFGEPATNASLRTYDAVYATTLAATCARSPEPGRVAEKLPVVWNADAGDTRVSGADAATALTVALGCAVDLVGATHDYDWLATGEPDSARFYAWVVAPGGQIRVATPRFEPS